MPETGVRMTAPGNNPTASQLAAWLGQEAYGFWKRVTQLIENRYPGVFSPDWLFGGKKHGWSLRYKKGKSFCTLIPEKDRLAVLVVFGAAERAKVEAIREELAARTRKDYDAATTYHDGKWLLLAVDSERMVEDVARLLAAKRKPKESTRDPGQPGA